MPDLNEGTQDGSASAAQKDGLMPDSNNADVNKNLEDKPTKSKLPIIIIAIVAGVILIPVGLVLFIAYFGILSPDVLLPERCTIAAPLNCEDHVVSAAVERAHGDDADDGDNVPGIEILLRNGGGKGLHIKSVVASSDAFPLQSGDENHKCSWVNPNGTGIFLFKAGEQKKFSLTNLDGPADVNGDTDATDNTAALLGTGVKDMFDFDGGTSPVQVDESNVTQENGCPYNDVGYPKNRYDIVIKYNLEDSPTLTHTLNGEIFASSPE